MWYPSDPMTLLTLVVTLCLVGLVLYGINNYFTMDAKIKKILNIVVVVVVVLYVLQAFGLDLLQPLRQMRVGR
jgi:small-conductance mechanosensitive channel